MTEPSGNGFAPVRNGPLPSILIVDDDQEFAQQLHSRVDQFGFRSTVATTFREALFKLKNQRFDCLLLDLRLEDPGGIQSGEGIVEFLRKNSDHPNGKIPILLISGYLSGDVVKRLGVNIAGALVKPFTTDTLLSRLNALFGKR